MDTILDDESLKNILDNPLWHLCRSNTENAMSNFWAYLMKSHGNNLEIILGEKANEYNGQVKEIRREKDHMDLQIIFDEAIVVIENKFKSLADLKQIDSYKEKIKKKHSDNHYFYLITPTQSDNTNNNNQGGYKILSYENVYQNIRNFLQTKGEDNLILQKYIELLENIVQFWEKIKNNENKYNLCLFWKKDREDDPQTANDVDTLVEEKLYAFIAKNLANRYQNELIAKEGINISQKIIQETDFSNSTPNMSWKVKDQNDEYSEGVQIQNGQFRLFVMKEDKKGKIDEKDLENWIEKLYGNDRPTWDGRNSKTFCKFGTWFKYKYFNIGSKEALEENLKKVFNYWKSTK